MAQPNLFTFLARRPRARLRFGGRLPVACPCIVYYVRTASVERVSRDDGRSYKSYVGSSLSALTGGPAEYRVTGLRGRASRALGLKFSVLANFIAITIVGAYLCVRFIFCSSHSTCPAPCLSDRPRSAVQSLGTGILLAVPWSGKMAPPQSEVCRVQELLRPGAKRKELALPNSALTFV